MTRFSLGFTESSLSPDSKAVYFSIYGLKGFSHRAVMMSVFLHDCCWLMSSFQSKTDRRYAVKYRLFFNMWISYIEKLSQMWDQCSFSFTFTSPAPHILITPPPNFTLGTMQSDKYRSPDNPQTQSIRSPSALSQTTMWFYCQLTLLKLQAPDIVRASKRRLAVWLGELTAATVCTSLLEKPA